MSTSINYRLTVTYNLYERYTAYAMSITLNTIRLLPNKLSAIKSVNIKKKASTNDIITMKPAKTCAITFIILRNKKSPKEDNSIGD